MPAFSGLYDGVFGDGYAALAAQSRPPMLRGLARVLMQKRGMHGTVNALGRASPANIAQVQATLGTVTARGGMETWPSRAPDAANTVAITNSATVSALEAVARVPDATEADLANSFDTTLNSAYAKDEAENGATAEALAGVNAT